MKVFSSVQTKEYRRPQQRSRAGARAFPSSDLPTPVGPWKTRDKGRAGAFFPAWL